MRVYICEDDPRDTRHLLTLLDTYAREEGVALSIRTYTHTRELLADPDALQGDLWILDIFMSPEDQQPYGVWLAQEVRRQAFGVAILFTTSSTEFYPQGFEVGAAHYLVKTIAYPDLKEAMRRVRERMGARERIYALPLGKETVEIVQSRIVYVEVYGHKTLLHTPSGTLRVMLSLHGVMELLEGDPFLQCFRSYIVNMDHIKSVDEAHFVLTNDTCIPIALRNRHQIKSEYLRYHLRGLHGREEP